LLEIVINKDIEHFKPDFFKGFTMKETIGLACSVSIILGGFAVMYFLVDLPVVVSVFVGIPFSIPVLLLGFVDFNKMGAIPLMKKAIKVIRQKPVIYKSTEIKGEGGGYLE
jgi:hypothetical protein